MASFLKIVSGVYLAFVWMILALVMKNHIPISSELDGDKVFIAFLAGIALSIPAVALFAFGQIVGDVRVIRNNLLTHSNTLQR